MWSVCYYDLETTGLNAPDHRGVEIISIGATTDHVWDTTLNGGLHGDFNQFIQPRGPIDPHATRVHGMSKDHYGRLIDRNNRIVRTTIFQPLDMFLYWLKKADCRFLVRFSSLVKYLLSKTVCQPISGCP